MTSRFTLLPAIDVAGGRAVRLAAGDTSSETDHVDALDAALAWQHQGAEWIHLVDLDAAFQRGSNMEVLARVIEELDVNVELSGGIDDEKSLANALHTKCTRVVLALSALHDRAWCRTAIEQHGDRIAVAIDVRLESDEYQLAPRGKASKAHPQLRDLWSVVKQLDVAGCARYIVTDVTKDGMLHGPNVALYEQVCQATATPVIASGGIASLDDIRALIELAGIHPQLEGAIVGKALYANKFTLAQALALC